MKTLIGHLPLCLLSLLFTACFPDLDLSDVGTEYPDGGEVSDNVPPAQEVSIATYNVEDFDLGGEGGGQYAFVARFTKESGIDILVLEEVANDAAGNDEEAFTQALEDVSYPMAYHLFSAMSDGFNAIGVWSRWPLLDAVEILPENTRTVFRFRVAISGQEIWLHGCHLKSGTDSESQARRIDEAERLEAFITAHHDPTTEDIVILGDMNTMSDGDWRDGGTMDFLTLLMDNPGNTVNDLTAMNYTELPTEWTNPAWESLLDHIILSPAALAHYVPGSVRVPHPAGEGTFGPSDHYPVLLNLMY